MTLAKASGPDTLKVIEPRAELLASTLREATLSRDKNQESDSSVERISALQTLRADLYEQRPATRDDVTAWRQFGLDHCTIEAHCGILVIANVTYYSRGGFDLDAGDASVKSAVIEVLAEDGETVVDIVAWPINAPQMFTSALGIADVLGAAQIENPATYFADAPIQAHRTPAGWLRAGGLC